MSNDLKKILSAIIIIIGFFAFIISTSNNNFNLGLIYLTSTIILWVSFGIALDVFDLRLFAGLISLSGFMVAISVFFLFGIEQVPYPVGAIIFHLEGISSALGISLFSLFPIITLSHIELEQSKSIKSGFPNQSQNKPEIVIDDEWEIASEDDLQSGEFEA